MFSSHSFSPPTTTALPSVSVDLPDQGISYKWNHPICDLLFLTSCTSRRFIVAWLRTPLLLMAE